MDVVRVVVAVELVGSDVHLKPGRPLFEEPVIAVHLSIDPVRKAHGRVAVGFAPEVVQRFGSDIAAAPRVRSELRAVLQVVLLDEVWPEFLADGVNDFRGV